MERRRGARYAALAYSCAGGIAPSSEKQSQLPRGPQVGFFPRLEIPDRLSFLPIGAFATLSSGHHSSREEVLAQVDVIEHPTYSKRVVGRGGIVSTSFPRASIETHLNVCMWSQLEERWMQCDVDSRSFEVEGASVHGCDPAGSPQGLSRILKNCTNGNSGKQGPAVGDCIYIRTFAFAKDGDCIAAK